MRQELKQYTTYSQASSYAPSYIITHLRKNVINIYSSKYLRHHLSNMVQQNIHQNIVFYFQSKKLFREETALQRKLLVYTRLRNIAHRSLTPPTPPKQPLAPPTLSLDEIILYNAGTGTIIANINLTPPKL